ncbi:MAG: biotin/lipoyl-binding protein [Thermodesulfobacteriota bacterium]
METLLILTYATLCWLIFKIFKIPLNKWTITTVILGGVLMLGTIMAGMAYFHPASKSARTYFVTTPIVANVRGKVIEVPVKANTPLAAGDVLFKIDPTPFQGVVDDLTAQLDFASKRLADSRKLVAVAGGAKFDVEQYQREVKSLEGKLVKARFNLASCVVRAPGAGFVTHLRAQPGQMAVALPLAPVMSFVNLEATSFVAGFSQQPMQNIKVGNQAEVMYAGIPGRVFPATVEAIIPALAEGELAPGNTLISLGRRLPEGQIPVLIRMEDDMSDFFIPMGSDAVVAVYSERWHHVQIIRKILLRMESWRNFLHFH